MVNTISLQGGTGMKFVREKTWALFYKKLLSLSPNCHGINQSTMHCHGS